jgi:predicted Fe-Mo cluster-binding NifX family protein
MDVKVAVSSTGQGLESAMDGRFGRCANFVIVDTESGEVTNLSNEAASSTGGAGIAAGAAVAKSGASVVLTGATGPNATRTLSELGIKVHVAPSGTVGQAIEAFKAGQCEEISSATVGSKSGMGGGGGGGRGQGGGRGMGGGRA